MNLFIQMGHGMNAMCKELCAAWQGATVILSPQNLYPTDKLAPYAESLKKLNGKILLDPQLYSPRKYQKNLQQHSYWPSSNVTNIELVVRSILMKAEAFNSFGSIFCMSTTEICINLTVTVSFSFLMTSLSWMVKR